MNYIKVKPISDHGALKISADPTGLLYIAITLPLMLATLILWLLWQCYDRRIKKLKRANPAAERTLRAWDSDVEMAVQSPGLD